MSPTLIMTTAPMRGVMVSMSVSFTPHLLHPGSWDPCFPWNKKCISVLLIYSHVWCTSEQWTYSCLPWRLSTIAKTGRWMCDTWYKRIQPTETVPGAVAARQLAYALVWIKNDWWAYCTDVHISKGVTLNLLQCLRVNCGCRAIQTNSAETLLALLHM